MSFAADILKKFVEGQMETRPFEEALYYNPDIGSLLSEEEAPRHASTSRTLYHYLIALDYSNPVGVLNAQSSLGQYLTAQGIEVRESSQRVELVNLIATAQPKWLDIDPVYVQALLKEAPETLSQGDHKKWLQSKILELFRCAKQPPRWLQAPAWPMGEERPLVFLGQVAIPDYFHDEAAAYVFHDPLTGQCQTVLQKC